MILIFHDILIGWDCFSLIAFFLISIPLLTYSFVGFFARSTVAHISSCIKCISEPTYILQHRVRLKYILYHIIPSNIKIYVGRLGVQLGVIGLLTTLKNIGLFCSYVCLIRFTII